MTNLVNDAPSPDADVITVEAGPAGMSAAIELATAGCRVIVLDMQTTPGGPRHFRAGPCRG
jgi:ribulose 1,5-bisphosphate synthetase/thiazole synthase